MLSSGYASDERERRFAEQEGRTSSLLKYCPGCHETVYTPVRLDIEHRPK